MSWTYPETSSLSLTTGSATFSTSLSCRNRTYDFLLKGLIFCHECGYPLAVFNRKNARGEDVLYFVCRTYQRFTKAGVCTCHSIKEKTVTDAVVAKVREICQVYRNPDELLPMPREAVENARKQSSLETELQPFQSKIDSLTANLDRMYTDRLSGLLPEADFQRIFSWIKLEREQLEEKRQALEFQKKAPSAVRTGPGNWYKGSSKPLERAGNCW